MLQVVSQESNSAVLRHRLGLSGSISLPTFLILGLAGVILVFGGAGQTLTGSESSQALQRLVSQVMAGRRGSVVVLHVKTGRVMAEYRKEIAARTLAHPGSTIKPFILLALLESRKVDAGTAVICPRQFRVGTRRLDCSHPATSEPITAVTALAYSCNTYFAKNGNRLTGEELKHAAAQSGLTSATGLAPDEAAGRVRQPRNEEERELLALGLDGIEVTPLELAAAYRRLALRRLQGPAPSGAMETVLQGLEESAEYGMAQLAEIPGFPVAGKTGTAPALNGSWTNAWFAGYAPAREPEIVGVVFLERGRGGVD